MIPPSKGKGDTTRGIMDTLQKLAPKAGQLADKLGLDDKAADVLGDLVEKLETLGKEDKLDDIAQNALKAFKPTLEKFRVDEASLDVLIDKAKDFVEKLSKADLPGDLEKVVAKVSALIKERLHQNGPFPQRGWAVCDWGACETP